MKTAKKLAKFAIFHRKPDIIPGVITFISKAFLFTKYIIVPAKRIPIDIENRNFMGSNPDIFSGTSWLPKKIPDTIDRKASLKFDFSLLSVIDDIINIPVIKITIPTKAVEGLRISLKKINPQINDINIAVPIHMGAAFERPEFWTANIENRFPVAHRIPEIIPKYEKTKFFVKKDLNILDMNIDWHITN